MDINKDNNIRIKLEEMGISSENIDDIVLYIESEKDKEVEIKREVPINDTKELLKQRMAAESDWRKKASIAAQLISIDL